MELLYLWIDNYRDFIVKQGFNFSSEYRFDYNSESGELKIEKNLNYIDNFFNLDKTNSTKINNITAIIGENGAGKSSILDFIKDNLVKGDNGFLEKAIMVLEINGKYYLYYNKDITINLQVKSDVLNFDERIQYETLYKRENVECYKWNTTLNPLSIIYFSNIFDGKYEISGGALYNISTNFLIKKDKRLAIEDKLINYEATESEVHRLFDINRQIDEGEIYLHPQWQKRFMYDLIEILPEIYSNKYIHIILTSHSPFVASDLPSSNIIFLKKDEKGRCEVVDGLEENNRTFGANIHTLFSDSFFMKDGLIGDFAKNKINELIKLLVDGDISVIKEKKDYIQKSIIIIGEPVIRTKLLNMLKEKLEVDLISLDERIANLERELDELKRKKAND
jgi:hypothetical protein